MNAEQRIFVDTNILVYAHDFEAGDKNRMAKDKVASLWRGDGTPVISVQVLQEFYVNLSKKGVVMEQCREAVEDYIGWELVVCDGSLVLKAIEAQQRWNISFWDALILEAARLGAAEVIWSEDFNSGQDYNGVVAINPFVK